MSRANGHIVMTSPDHFDVSYSINPWMKPAEWEASHAFSPAGAKASWTALKDRLESFGLTVETIPAVPGLPDLVFPANAAIVLDGKALLARFRCQERRGEEAVFLDFFRRLQERGLIDEIATLPEGLFQEGAGDCLWDAERQLFWAGHGQRSLATSVPEIAAFFGRQAVALELATPEYYHLDTCFSPLPYGELLYYPGAFTDKALSAIEALVPADRRLIARPDEAAAFALNMVAVGRDLVMAPPPPRLAALLAERGYRVHPVDLKPFMLSGGAAYCMTLRLDRTSCGAARQAAQ